MRYLYYYQGSLNPKNKVEELFYHYLKSFNRSLFLYMDLGVIMEEMKKEAAKISQENKRCRPVEIKFSPVNPNGDIHLFVGTGDTTSFKATFLKIND